MNVSNFVDNRDPTHRCRSAVVAQPQHTRDRVVPVNVIEHGRETVPHPGTLDNQRFLAVGGSGSRNTGTFDQQLDTPGSLCHVGIILSLSVIGVIHDHREQRFGPVLDFREDLHRRQIGLAILAPDLVLLDKPLRGQAVAILAGLD